MSVVGMGIVFAVLALLSLSIKGLSLLDREPAPSPVAQASSAAGTASTSVTGSPDSVATGEITGEQVASIAVALALSEPVPTAIPTAPGGGATTGSWLQSGRIRSLGSNKPATPVTRKRRDQ